MVLVNNNAMLSTYGLGDGVVIRKCFNAYQNNDVVYFEFPIKDSSNKLGCFMLRICALPGDSFEIKDKKVYVNDVIDSSLVYDLKNNYFIKTQKVKLDSLFKKKYNLIEGGEISEEWDYSYALTQKESELLKLDPLIQSVELKIENANLFDELCFPSNVNYAWNKDHYGKIYIPKKDDTLHLDTVNISLYTSIISDYENKLLEVRNDSIFIDSIHTNAYVVEQDYYYVLGDNRSNANDSRMWGYLPKNCIKGKVIGRIYRK